MKDWLLANTQCGSVGGSSVALLVIRMQREKSLFEENTTSKVMNNLKVVCTVGKLSARYAVAQRRVSLSRFVGIVQNMSAVSQKQNIHPSRNPHFEESSDKS